MSESPQKLRQCYPFLNKFKLCANITTANKHQELELCEYDATKEDLNAPCNCDEDHPRITCIHTAVTMGLEDIPRTSREAQEKLGRIVSSEGKEISDLTLETKWEAFKSWTAGIAESGMDSFFIQGQLDEINRAYPIAKPLLKYVAQKDPTVMAKLIDEIEQSCTFDGEPHLPCIQANLESIKGFVRPRSLPFESYRKLLHLYGLVKEDMKEIDLSGMAEVKTFPEELTGMTEIKTINLDETNIASLERGSLAQFKKLEKLTLRNTPFMRRPYREVRKNLEEACVNPDGSENINCLNAFTSQLDINSIQDGKNIASAEEYFTVALLKNIGSSVRSMVLENYANVVIPPEISDFKGLETITLVNTQNADLTNLTLAPNINGITLSKGKKIKIPSSLPFVKALVINDYENIELPTSFSYPQLRELVFFGNKNVTQLPKIIANKLDSLSIHDTGISSFPEIDAPNINALVFTSNKNVSEFPNQIISLKNLRTLSLSGNGLINIPDTISELPELRSLTLSNNKLDKLPSTIGNLRYLNTLLANNNKITSIPSILMQMPLLQRLDLSMNNIASLPEPISMPMLQSINLSNNQLTDVPEALLNLRQRVTVDVSWNKLEKKPAAAPNIVLLAHKNPFADAPKPKKPRAKKTEP